jgi:hypothetical protein
MLAEHWNPASIFMFLFGTVSCIFPVHQLLGLQVDVTLFLKVLRALQLASKLSVFYSVLFYIPLLAANIK